VDDTHMQMISLFVCYHPSMWLLHFPDGLLKEMRHPRSNTFSGSLWGHSFHTVEQGECIHPLSKAESFQGFRCFSAMRGVTHTIQAPNSMLLLKFCDQELSGVLKCWSSQRWKVKKFERM